MATPIATQTASTVGAGIGWRTTATVIAPVLLGLVGVLSPINDSDEPAERLADVFANSGRYNVAVVCLAAAMMLLVPAAFAVRDLAPASARRAATIGASVAAAGFMSFLVASGALGFGPAAWTSSPDASAESPDLLAAFTAMDEGEGALGVALFGPLLPVIGFAVLAAVLWRHTEATRWALVALPLGWSTFLFAPINAMRSIGAAVLLLGLVGSGAAARQRTGA